MKTNLITILKVDHATVERLFEKYANLSSTAYGAREQIARSLSTKLATHFEMEESLIFPRFAKMLDAEDLELITEATTELDFMKTALEELRAFDSTTAEFSATMNVLMQHIRHHVHEAEEEILPRIEEKISEIGLWREEMVQN